MDEALALLDKAIEECFSVPLWARSSEEIVGYLERAHAIEQRIAVLCLGLVREVDAREVAQKHPIGLCGQRAEAAAQPVPPKTVTAGRDNPGRPATQDTVYFGQCLLRTP